MIFAIPPANYAQREAMQKELMVEYQLLGDRIKILRSVQEVADFLNECGFRRGRPVKKSTIKRWMNTRGFPWTRWNGGRSFLTTSAHVFAWLWTMSMYSHQKTKK